MIVEFLQQNFIPCSFNASYPPEGRVAAKRAGRLLEIPERVAVGEARVEEISSGLYIIRSEMSFARDTSFREEYPERDVLQIAFCLHGTWEWSYGEEQGYQLAPSECSLQCGLLRRCDSSYQSGQYRALSVSLDRNRFAAFVDCLEEAHLLRPGYKIHTRVFASTPRLRLVLRQLLEGPLEQKLRALYLEGKVLELLSVFCSEVVGLDEKRRYISKEDYRSILQARARIDEQFLRPLTISQIAKMCYLSETKLKRGFKACFGCTVYEYVVEKRMEMACRLLQSGKYRVKDVVWMTGYSNAGHFIDTFRKRYGVTPSEIS